MHAALAALLLAAAGDRVVLDNGMTVLLRPVDNAPNVAVVMLYSIGEDQDPPGRSGLSHLVEHLYVTAAAGDVRPARSALAMMQAYPLGWNAQTGESMTVIATIVAAADLDAELVEAAARMGDLRVTDADLAREKPRMVQEVGNMFDRVPGLAAYNRARDMARPCPSGGRRGGLPAHIAEITTAEAIAHWRKYYKPVNARLAIAGGFDADTVRARIGELFGGIAAGEPVPEAAPRKRPDEARVDRLTIANPPPGSKGQACAAWAAPMPGDEHYAAFLVLVTRMALAGGFAGGFPAPVTWLPIDDPGVVVLGEGVGPPEEVAAALDARIDQAAARPVGPTDLMAVRNVYGPHLGLVPTPPQLAVVNPYGVALAAAVRDRYAVDAAALGEALGHVDADALRAAAEAVFPAGRRSLAIVEIAE